MTSRPPAPYYDKFSVVGSLVDVRVQSPKWSFTKRNDRGVADFVSPLPIFFNYGCIDTWKAADGEGVDALVLGKRLHAGERVRMRVRGVVQFEDAGRDDFKCVCAAYELTGLERFVLGAFFSVYAIAKRVKYAMSGIRGTTRYHGWIVSAQRSATDRR
jgi:hypothetical protein